MDIIELREHDHARDRDAVRATVPVRVTIDIDKFWTHENLDRPKVHASVHPMVLEPLYDVRIRYWRRLNIVLTGRQRQAVPGRKSSEAMYEQTWWCRLVLNPSVAPMAPIARKRSAPTYNGNEWAGSSRLVRAADS